MVHSVSQIEIVPLYSEIATGGGHAHSSTNILFVPLTHLVDVDDVAHSIKVIESLRLIHSAQTGTSHSHDVKIIDIIPSSTSISTGCSYAHSIKSIDVVPLGGQGGGGSSYDHNNIIIDIIPLSHSAGTGTLHQHQSNISELVLVASVIKTGANFAASPQILEVFTQTHRASKVIRYNATPSQAVIISGIHVVTTPIHHYPEVPKPEYVDPPRIHGDYENPSRKQCRCYENADRIHGKYVNPDKTRGSYVSS